MTGLCSIWTRVHWQHDSHEPVDTGLSRMPNLAQADGLPPCSTHGNAFSGHSITCVGCAHASLCALNFLALPMWHSTRSAQEHSGNLTVQKCRIVRRCGTCAHGALIAQSCPPVTFLVILVILVSRSTCSALEHSGNLTIQKRQIVHRCGMCARAALCALSSPPTYVAQLSQCTKTLWQLRHGDQAHQYSSGTGARATC